MDDQEFEIKFCPICDKVIGGEHGFEDFKVNHKILSLIEKPDAVKLTNYIPCELHDDKPVEYFCKACALAVCVKCIYDSHNGHNLVQIDEMCKKFIHQIS